MDHLPSAAGIEAWPAFTPAAPLRILVSACITGVGCGFDGSSYGAPFAHVGRLLDLPNVVAIPFCPEDVAFGTPRAIPDIHGGNGHDVLDGNARVVDDTGRDVTDALVDVAHQMLDVARAEQVRIALLMDISAACGSQVIYLGARAGREYQAGQGVCAAMLVRNGIKVLSQRDFEKLGLVIASADSTFRPDPAARDHHDSDWYVHTFGAR
jgi:uncharacterized protein YbbK (DUF523 family)